MTTTFEVSEDLLDDYIRLILFYTWDPIRLNSYRRASKDVHEVTENDEDIIAIQLEPSTFNYGISESEYDSYIYEVEELLVQQKPLKDIYRLLREIETVRMCIGNAAITKIAAQRLYAAGQNILKTTIAPI